jgi:hypothetical protein
MAHNPLSGDGRHVFIGVVDPLAAIKAQPEGDGVG